MQAGVRGPYAEEQTWELQKMHLEAKCEIEKVLFGKVALEPKDFCPSLCADKTNARP